MRNLVAATALPLLLLVVVALEAVVVIPLQRQAARTYLCSPAIVCSCSCNRHSCRRQLQDLAGGLRVPL